MYLLTSILCETKVNRYLLLPSIIVKVTSACHYKKTSGWTLKWYVLIFFLMSQGTIYWHPSYGAQRCHKSHNGCLFDVLMTSIWVIRMTSCFGLGRVSHDNHVMSNILYLIPCFDMDLMSIDILYLTWFDVKLTLFDTLHYTNRLSIDIQGRLRSIDLQVSSVTYCWIFLNTWSVCRTLVIVCLCDTTTP